MPWTRTLAVAPLKGAALVAVVCLAAGDALAWGRSGHREVCLIAWEKMTEPTRTAVLDLLDAKTADQFADSCYWADEVRPKRPETGPWHYVNVPKDARTIDLDRDCPLPASCVVREIDRQAAILTSDSPKAERAEALMFLAHFVGDLHQPLHVGFREDRGGNEISVTFRGRRTNMHALWDWGLLETLPSVLAEQAPYMTTNQSDSRGHWTEGTTLDWAHETLRVMQAPATGYMDNPGGVDLDAVYVRLNYPVAREQVEKASVRLGHVLNQVLGKR